MEELLNIVGAAIVALLVGSVIGYYIRQSIARKRAGTIEAELQKRITQTKQTTEELVAKAKEKVEAIEQKSYSEIEERQKVIIKAENRIFKKEEEIETREKETIQKEKDATGKLEKLKEIKADLDTLKNEAIGKLEKIAGLNKEQAKDELLEKAEREYQAEILERIRKLEDRGAEQYEKKAREIISVAVQGYALSQAQEITTSSVAIPSDEIKGRIIGKEVEIFVLLKKHQE